MSLAMIRTPTTLLIQRHKLGHTPKRLQKFMCTSQQQQSKIITKSKCMYRSLPAAKLQIKTAKESTNNTRLKRRRHSLRLMKTGSMRRSWLNRIKIWISYTVRCLMNRRLKFYNSTRSHSWICIRCLLHPCQQLFSLLRALLLQWSRYLMKRMGTGLMQWSRKP